MGFDAYEPGDFFDEWMEAPGSPRPEARALAELLGSLPARELEARQAAAERTLRRLGITFNVYGHAAGAEKVWPFDVVPRLMARNEWTRIERGLRQRIAALNLFLHDIYHEQRIVRAGVIPEAVIRTARAYRPECEGLHPPAGIWAHITGSDLVRDRDGRIYVLEDNLRCPSGVSYVIENREVMKRVLPELFRAARPMPVDDYPGRLLETLQFAAPRGVSAPRVAVLTPGVYNSAYFEHAFLARRMGVPLVEGRDLRIEDGRLKMRTRSGAQPIDVLYRRVDDDFLDPEAFRPDSMLGVPGLFRAYREGRVTLVNAPGTGVADDKAVYPYVPKMIRFYLGEEAQLPNVPTYLCSDPVERAYVLEHLEDLVVKAANESGGYGMLVGPQSTREQREEFKARIQQNPRNYIAQPTLALSRVPTLIDGRLEGRHVDLRPFVLYGPEIYVQPGGLTRVALRAGSLVVNSSQGGGSKDTWVVPSVEADALRPVRPAGRAAVEV
jgi:uncharacterized circularly permuted ATP-grasp superfamily protein